MGQPEVLDETVGGGPVGGRDDCLLVKRQRFLQFPVGLYRTVEKSQRDRPTFNRSQCCPPPRRESWASVDVRVEDDLHLGDRDLGDRAGYAAPWVGNLDGGDAHRELHHDGFLSAAENQGGEGDERTGFAAGEHGQSVGPRERRHQHGSCRIVAVTVGRRRNHACTADEVPDAGGVGARRRPPPVGRRTAWSPAVDEVAWRLARRPSSAGAT